MRGRPALLVVFAGLGALSATWASRIPAVAAHLHLSPGSLGAVLLGPALGLVVSTAGAAAALRRVRPQVVMAAGIIVFAAALAAVAHTASPLAAFALLVAWGAGGGALDVAMNVEAAAVQDLAGRPVMSGLHAAFSVGGLAGAGLGALAAGAHLSVGVHLGVASAVVGAAGLIATAAAPHLGPVPAAGADPGRPRRPPWALATLGVVAFAGLMAEGAANDWSALWLHRDRGASLGTAALGYAAFALAMAVGRLSGDRLTERLGPVRLLRAGATVAAGGFALSLAGGDAATGIAGFAVLGAGLSVVVPLVVSAAAAAGRSGTSVAVVNGSGYVGLMLGPPIIGGVADLTGLTAALVVVVAAAGVAAALAGATRPATGGGSR